MPDARVFRRCIVCRSHAADFGGSNVEASPYPSAEVIRGLAPSSVKLTGKPFWIGPLMVELFAAVAFFDGPRTGQSGFACHQAESSPRRAGCTIRRNGPGPPAWDYAVRRLPHPLWSMAALLSQTEQGGSASPSLRQEIRGCRPEGLMGTFACKIERPLPVLFLRPPA